MTPISLIFFICVISVNQRPIYIGDNTRLRRTNK